MNLERLILCELLSIGGNMMLTRTLHNAINLASPALVSEENLVRALHSLKLKDQVFGAETDDGVKWKITSQGKARLAE